MRKVFIDAGGYTGDTVRLFLEQYENADQFEIFCFEPNPNFLESHKDQKYTFLPYAVWTQDCDMDFHLCSNNLGSSLLKSKLGKHHRHIGKVKVKAINFSKWIKENFSKDDFIVLKMDIEGAEYDVLRHMVDQGSIYYIKELYVDWHARKISNFDQSVHTNLHNYLVGIGLKPGDMCGETWRINK
jgi:FkbM family methyltransferase